MISRTRLSSTSQVLKNIAYLKACLNLTSYKPWFVGRDVAEMLGYNQADKAINRHVDEDDRMKRTVIDSLDRNQMTYIINESGLYTENYQKIGLKINSFECFYEQKGPKFPFAD